MRFTTDSYRRTLTYLNRIDRPTRHSHSFLRQPRRYHGDDTRQNVFTLHPHTDGACHPNLPLLRAQAQSHRHGRTLHRRGITIFTGRHAQLASQEHEDIVHEQQSAIETISSPGVSSRPDPTLLDPAESNVKRAAMAKAHTKLPAKANDIPQLPLPLQVSVDGELLSLMVKTMRDARLLGLPDQVEPPQPIEALPSQEQRKIIINNNNRLTFRSRILKARQLYVRATGQYRAVLKARQKLPVMQHDVHRSILEHTKKSDVLILSAATGSGKSTQVPQIILDAAIDSGRGAFCRIICTQPRRISATSLARRVAYERGEKIGNGVGHHVRFDHRWPATDGSILYCTTGVLLRRFLEESEYLMDTTSHLIIDEVHERTLATDHLLTLLRNLMHQRKEQGKLCPKVIIMSATIDGKGFRDYFAEPLGSKEQLPRPLKTRYLEAPGRMYTVRNHYLEDFLPALRTVASQNTSFADLLDGRKDNLTPRYITRELELQKPDPLNESEEGTIEDSFDESEESTIAETPTVDPIIAPHGLLAATIAYVAATTHEGDILAFVPGLAEAEKTIGLLSQRPLGLDFGGQLQMFKLHSSLADTNEQVFNPIPKLHRRVILATNIAETSITLPDVRTVIDMGTARSSVFDSLTGEHMLSAKWISKANLKQRRGRAGRTCDGDHYALFTKARFETFEEQSAPEVVRLDLSSTCLEIAYAKVTDIPTFMSQFPTPPAPEKVVASLSSLQRLGAITARNEITLLGQVLARIPLEPAAAKTVMLGILFKCLEPMLIIGCCEEDTGIVEDVSRSNTGRSRRTLAGLSESDWIATYNAYKKYEHARWNGNDEEVEQLRTEYYVREATHREIGLVVRQVYEHFSRTGLVPRVESSNLLRDIASEMNVNASNSALVKALLLATQTSNIAAAKGTGSRFMLSGGGMTLPGPGTVNHLKSSHFFKERGRIRSMGDLLAHGRRRETQSAPISWIDNSSFVTPLMAVLFANNAQRKDDTTITLNNLVNLSFATENNVLGLDNKTATTLVLEFRKAIDRFLLTAFAGLQRANQLLAGLPKDESYLDIMANAKLRDQFVAGVASVLQMEDDALMEKFKQHREIAVHDEEAVEDILRTKLRDRRIGSDHTPSIMEEAAA